MSTDSSEPEEPPQPLALQHGPTATLNSLQTLLAEHVIIRRALMNPYGSHADGTHAFVESVLDSKRRPRMTQLFGRQITSGDPAERQQVLETMYAYFLAETSACLEVIPQDERQEAREEACRLIEKTHGDLVCREVLQQAWSDGDLQGQSEAEVSLSEGARAEGSQANLAT